MSVPNFIVKNLKKCFFLLTIQPDLVKEYGDVVKKCEEMGFLVRYISFYHFLDR